MYNKDDVIRSNNGLFFIVRKVAPDRYGCICPKCSIYGQCSSKLLKKWFNVTMCEHLIGSHIDRPYVLLRLRKGTGGDI